MGNLYRTKWGLLEMLAADGCKGKNRKAMPKEPPQLPSLEIARQILRGEQPKSKAAFKPTGRYFVSAATFQGLLLSVKDQAVRVAARATDELQFEYEGHTWTIVRSTAVKEGVHVEYE